MFLTDGGTEMPEEVFDKYNSDKEVSLIHRAIMVLYLTSRPEK